MNLMLVPSPDSCPLPGRKGTPGDGVAAGTGGRTGPRSGPAHPRAWLVSDPSLPGQADAQPASPATRMAARREGCLFCHVSCTNSSLSTCVNNSATAAGVGEGAVGRSRADGSVETVTGGGQREPGALPPRRGLATEPGGLKGPGEESAGLAAAPGGQNVPPEADPGHLGPDGSGRLETGLRVHRAQWLPARPAASGNLGQEARASQNERGRGGGRGGGAEGGEHQGPGPHPLISLLGGPAHSDSGFVSCLCPVLHECSEGRRSQCPVMPQQDGSEVRHLEELPGQAKPGDAE